MGCFNVAGTLSRLSIGVNEPAVFIPLIPAATGYRGHKREDGGRLSVAPCSMLVSNGTSALYTPRFLPIKGVYNDYGSLEGIERDANVEAIEAHFGITIDQFMEQVTRNWCDSKEVDCPTEAQYKELRSLSGMFEHRHVYDAMVELAAEEDNAFTARNYLDDTVLPHIADLEQEDDGIQIFRLKGAEAVKIHHEAGCYDSSLVLPDGQKLERVGSVSDLYFGLGRLGIGGLIELEKLSDTTLTGLQLGKLAKPAPLSLVPQRMRDKYLGMAKGPDTTWDEQEALAFLQDIADQKRSDNLLEREMPELGYAFRSAALTDALEDLLHFNTSMFSANSHYMPAMNGEQHGNDEISLALLTASRQVIERREAERAEEDF